MLIHIAQEMTIWLADPSAWADWQTWLWQISIDPDLLAQFNENVFARFNTALDNFIQSGQVWALLIGLIMGYLIRGFTTYG